MARLKCAISLSYSNVTIDHSSLLFGQPGHRVAFADALRHFLKASPDEIDPRRIMKPAIEAIKETAKSKLKEFRTRNVLN